MAMTAAEKQKRYRERKSNANVTKAVTNDEVTQPEFVTDNEPISRAEVIEHVLVEGEKVYGRSAVQYLALIGEAWTTRPQPDDSNDMPVPGNRGRYERLDGSRYQFDACGELFDLTEVSPGKWEVYPGTSYKEAANDTATRTQAREAARLERAQPCLASTKASREDTGG